jgi:hypothetical protein
LLYVGRLLDIVFAFRGFSVTSSNCLLSISNLGRAYLPQATSDRYVTSIIIEGKDIMKQSQKNEKERKKQKKRKYRTRR